MNDTPPPRMTRDQELRDFLCPEHKWVYFTIRALRTNGWVYFLMNMLPLLGTFLISDQPKTAWTITGTIFLALAAGFVSLKAYRSQSPASAQAERAERKIQKHQG